MKNSSEGRVVGVDGLVLKTKVPPTIISSVKFAFRPSRAQKAFRLAQLLISRKLPTPKPVAWATVRFARLRKADYLFTEYMKNTNTLFEYLEDICPDGKSRTFVVAELGRLLARFHKCGFSNRDMKAANILVSRDADIKLWVVDLDGVKKLRNISKRRAYRDIEPISLALSRYGQSLDSDKSVFLEAYNSILPENMQLDMSAGICEGESGGLRAESRELRAES